MCFQWQLQKECDYYIFHLAESANISKLTYTQLNNIGIVGPDNNGSYEYYWNPFNGLHTTRAGRTFFPFKITHAF